MRGVTLSWPRSPGVEMTVLELDSNSWQVETRHSDLSAGITDGPIKATAIAHDIFDA